MNEQDVTPIGMVDRRTPVMVARIQVNVRRCVVETKPDNPGVPSKEEWVVETNPEVLRVPIGEGCVIVWELNDSDSRWEFLGHGIAFKDDEEDQFLKTYRYKNGKKVAFFDRNTFRRPYRYTVVLVDPKQRKVIKQDPIIENEGDG